MENEGWDEGDYVEPYDEGFREEGVLETEPDEVVKCSSFCRN